MDRKKIVELADIFYYEGLGFKSRSSIPKASRLFAVSFGLNAQLERVEYMKFCLDNLRSIGLTEDELRESKLYGHRIALKGMRAYDIAIKNLGRK